MVLNLINIIEVGIVWILLFPHLIYAVRSAEGMVRCENKIVNLTAQIGRYASMLLMVLPLGIWEFGFPSNVNAAIYFIGNILLLAGYIITWVIYFKKNKFGILLTLIVLEASVFFLCGFMLEHWLLVISSAVFALGNILAAVIKNKEISSND